jgi:hypothetical protein
VALDELTGSDECRQHYTDEERQAFDRYVEEQLKRVRLQNPDWPYLRERMLTMYANPVLNKRRAVEMCNNM